MDYYCSLWIICTIGLNVGFDIIYIDYYAFTIYNTHHRHYENARFSIFNRGRHYLLHFNFSIIAWYISLLCFNFASKRDTGNAIPLIYFKCFIYKNSHFITYVPSFYYARRRLPILKISITLHALRWFDFHSLFTHYKYHCLELETQGFSAVITHSILPSSLRLHILGIAMAFLMQCRSLHFHIPASFTASCDILDVD